MQLEVSVGLGLGIASSPLVDSAYIPLEPLDRSEYQLPERGFSASWRNKDALIAGNMAEGKRVLVPLQALLSKAAHGQFQAFSAQAHCFFTLLRVHGPAWPT